MRKHIEAAVHYGFHKGQEALDFLMTYGWAIALVVIIAGVLFALGVFDVSNFLGSKASGFSGVAVAGWSLDSAGMLSLKLTNEAGQSIRIDSISITVDQNSTELASGLPAISSGESSDVLNTSSSALGARASNSGYNAKVVIAYTDLSSGFQYTSKGTLTGKVLEGPAAASPPTVPPPADPFW